MPQGIQKCSIRYVKRGYSFILRTGMLGLNHTIIIVWYCYGEYNEICIYYLIQINHQPDATIFQFTILPFIYSSTCFGRFPDHHQELDVCSGSLWFYLHIVVTVVLCLWSGRPARPRTQHDWKIVASSWWFIWIVQWCTDLQTLDLKKISITSLVL